MSNRYYDSDDDYDETSAFLDEPRLSKSINVGTTGLPHPEAHLLQKKQKQRIIWMPTFFFSLLWMLCTICICIICVITNLWLSLGVGVAMVVLGAFLAPFGKFAYKDVLRDNPRNKEWQSTLKSTIVVGAILGALAAIFGGYFYRNIYQANSHNRYSTVDPTKDPVLNIGTIDQFKDFGNVAAQYVGRSLSFALWPVCVAPILDKDGSSTVINYWALSSGRCCTAQVPKCGSWDLNQGTSNPVTAGGIRAHYRELTPSIQKAMDDTIKNSPSFTVNPHAKVVFFGDQKTLKDNFRWKAITSFSILSSTAILVIFVKSRWGIYEPLR